MQQSSKHIFIVQNNANINSEILNYYLCKNVSYRFICFNSAEKSIAGLYLNPDIIIMDDGLINMDTDYVFQKIKGHKEQIHLVVLTNKGDETYTTQLVKAGADEYIVKRGCNEKQILSKIHMVLSNNRFSNNSLALSGSISNA